MDFYLSGKGENVEVYFSTRLEMTSSLCQAEGQNVEVCQRTFSTSLEMTTRLRCHPEQSRRVSY